MDAALIINGVVDTVFRNAVAADMPEYPTGQWVDAPEGEVFGGFVYADGAFSPPSKPFDELKAAKRAAVSALLDAKLSAGYEHDFGAPYGVKKLQTRDIEDRTNWLTSQASYGAAIAAGAGAVMGANFRTEDNININLSYSDGHAVLLAMAQWGAAKYANSWALKDAIAEAADEAALDAIDIESGW